ncbi:MAG: NADH-quinone oxidoreductase subunit N, partial [Acidimicrobiia bacterium]|nr:NADH-quinone oxidoreductase subunit N [Acidimicrobiia bacterium]
MTWDLDYLALAPEITIAVTLLGVLGLDLVLPRQRKYLTAIVGLLGLVVAGFFLVVLATSDVDVRSMMSGSYVVDDFAIVLKGLFVLSGYIVLLMSVSYIESERYYQGEYYFLLMASILGSIVMSSSRDLIV